MNILWQNKINRFFNHSENDRKYIATILCSSELTHHYWDYPKDIILKNIKKNIYKRLSRLQHGRCAYCGVLKIGEKLDIEHIITKAYFLKIMFDPKNLVLACKQCNRDYKVNISPLKKRSKHGKILNKNPIINSKFDYDYWHPYFHNPNEYFEYSGLHNSLINPKKDLETLNPRKYSVACRTLSLFKLDEFPSVMRRVENAELLIGMKNKDPKYMALIREIKNYKK